jgi:hypothetical protein
VSTNKTRPAFSVTSAIDVIGMPLPGRKDIAQGSLKTARSVFVNG